MTRGGHGVSRPRALQPHTLGSPTGLSCGMDAVFLEQRDEKTLAGPFGPARVGKSKLLAARGLEFYLYFHAAGEIELHQLVHRFLGRADQLDEAFMYAHLELLAGLLVHVNRAVHRVLADPRGEKHGPGYKSPGPLRRVDDLHGGLVYQPVVIRVQPDADPLLSRLTLFGFFSFGHIILLSPRRLRIPRCGRLRG